MEESRPNTIIPKEGKALVVSHDAGGAEILSSLLVRGNYSHNLCLDGPAIKIFKRKLGGIKNYSIEHGLANSDWILTGTSWQSDLEYRAIGLAKKSGKFVASFLDHWVNYRERITREGQLVLPDELWVADKEAKRICQSEFPNANIVLVENPYFERLKEQIVEIEKISTKANLRSVLYVCEPVREHAYFQHKDEEYWGYTEESALRYFFKHMTLLEPDMDKIVIRPHPSEEADKYNWALAESPIEATIGGGKNLLVEIVESGIVVGCESVAMVVGLLAGKKVVSCIPPGGRDCSLPHETILHLKDLVFRK